MAAPAVWVRVLQVARCQKGAILLEHGDDDRVGLPDGFALEGRRRSKVPRGRVDVDAAAGVDTSGRVEAILLAGVEVVGAMGRGGVHCAGAGVGGNVGGQDAQDAAVEERVLEGGALELAAFEAGELGGFAEIAGGDDRCGQLGGNNVDGAGLSLRA